MPRLLLFTPLFIALVGGVYILSPQHTENPQSPFARQHSIGSSVEDRSINVHHFGHGQHQLVIVGGMHGGYEWNTSLLAYELIEYFTANTEQIPADVQLSVIPVANPDGLYAIAGTTTSLASLSLPSDPQQRAVGRFNANMVDLNRNFDCKWQSTSTWGTQSVSAGTMVFSEPEAESLRRFLEEHSPDAVIFLHSKANAVYGSECEEGVLAKTTELLETYATASGYEPIEQFDSYPITGDAEGWLASIGIPAITVELADHENTEFERNVRGVEAVMGWVIGE